ncbi:TatD family hydrolase [Aminipila luticellarii]|uniref:TatD family hydrolase n=1 Tax=Aminipila luticellarii TaxID=2507160 RepID=UPI00196A7164|nr:TatD family hydrolase [Aminipila luticellarii]
MILDSHTHIDNKGSLGIGIDHESPLEFLDFKSLIEEKQLGVLANAACASEYEELSQIKGIFISFGIHPWNADEFCEENNQKGGSREQTIEQYIHTKVQELKDYYRKAHAIGEIGMDSVWCACDLTLQKLLFREQLSMAVELQKPIVLHTKGQEKEIADILKDYSLKKLVHWYSCEEHLKSFIDQDCYFTVGPDHGFNPAVKKLIHAVPLNRLLVETDGISAVEWATGRKVNASEIPTILKETIQAIAAVKGVSPETAEIRLEENFYRYLSV